MRAIAYKNRWKNEANNGKRRFSSIFTFLLRYYVKITKECEKIISNTVRTWISSYYTYTFSTNYNITTNSNLFNHSPSTSQLSNHFPSPKTQKQRDLPRPYRRPPERCRCPGRSHFAPPWSRRRWRNVGGRGDGSRPARGPASAAVSPADGPGAARRPCPAAAPTSLAASRSTPPPIKTINLVIISFFFKDICFIDFTEDLKF